MPGVQKPPGDILPRKPESPRNDVQFAGGIHDLLLFGDFVHGISDVRRASRFIRSIKRDGGSMILAMDILKIIEIGLFVTPRQ
jgi:hypothetical protein